MNRQELEEQARELELTEEGEKAIRKKSLLEWFRELWFIPVYAGIFSVVGAFLGCLWGQGKERLVSRDTGKTYPFSSPLGDMCSLGLLLLGLPTAGIFLSYKQGEGERDGSGRKVFLFPASQGSESGTCSGTSCDTYLDPTGPASLLNTIPAQLSTVSTRKIRRKSHETPHQLCGLGDHTCL